jgi:type VI secretion system protein ImpE
MSAEESLKEGRLEDALAELSDQVRKDPSSPKLRIFLFQILCVTGEWKRALTQLNVLGEMDASTLPMVQTYREAIGCEVLRADIFAGKRSPLIFGEPEPWLAHLTEALKLTAEGKHEQAATLREQAFEGAPTTTGRVDGQDFEWVADADMRMGPVLEVIVNGRLYWAPFMRIHRIATEEPEDLRDMVWTPAQLTWSNGGQTVGLVPTRYPGSEKSEDPLIRLSRKTEWVEEAPDAWRGLGTRLFATDAGEHSILDIRELELDTLEIAEEQGAEPVDG